MLQIPKPQLKLPWVNNLPATPVNSPGTTVAANVSVNTKGSWTQIFAAAAVTYDVYGITLGISDDSVSAGQARNLYDIGIGGSGSEVVKVPNILHTGYPATANPTPWREFFLPIFIPKGTRISMRMQSSVSSNDGICAMFLHGGGGLAPWACFTGCDSYATDVATSGGQSHTTGAAGTYSSWTNLGSALSRDYGAIIPMIGVGTDTTMTNFQAYLQLGIASVEFATFVYGVSSAEYIRGISPVIPLFHRWSSGSQLMLRSTVDASAPVDSNYGFGFLAFY